MSYTPFLIAQYATGVDRHLQPWLIPKDALVELLDGYVYRGVMNKRDGYSGYATGESSIYCESRMVHAMAIAAPTTGAIDGNNKTFTFAVIAPNLPIRRGTFVITGSNPVQVMTDNGIGAFTGAAIGAVGTDSVSSFLMGVFLESTFTFFPSIMPFVMRRFLIVPVG